MKLPVRFVRMRPSIAGRVVDDVNSPGWTETRFVWGQN